MISISEELNKNLWGGISSQLGGATFIFSLFGDQIIDEDEFSSVNGVFLDFYTGCFNNDLERDVDFDIKEDFHWVFGLTNISGGTNQRLNAS